MCFSSTKTTNSTQNTANNVPAWLSGAGEQIGEQATGNAISHNYQYYGGPTQADFGNTFGTAENNATNLAATPNTNFSAGTGALQQGLGLAGATASAPVSSLMSQYTQAALNPTLDAIQRQGAATNQGLATGATMAGAFGDTGYGTQKATNDYNTTQAISNATGTAYNNAYNSALGTQQTALSQLMSGVGQASGLGSASNSAQNSDNQLLGSLGSTAQQAGQTGINTAINVNNQNQMGQLQQDALAAGTLAAVPKDTTSFSSGTSATTSPDNTGLGLLGSALGGLL